ncbi:hypothetical protein Hdeb2414_s0027g00690061 [Helianthus debilis subsp. tardiflorus]
MIHPVLILAGIILILLPTLMYELPPHLFSTYVFIYLFIAVPLYVISFLMSI